MYRNLSPFLADHTAHSNWHDTVVCPSVTLCIVFLRVGVVGSKLNHRVPRTAFPIYCFTLLL